MHPNNNHYSKGENGHITRSKIAYMTLSGIELRIKPFYAPLGILQIFEDSIQPIGSTSAMHTRHSLRMKYPFACFLVMSHD